MPWSEDRARERIARLMNSAPAGAIAVEEFASYFERRSSLVETARRAAAGASEPIWFVPRDRAITTHGVHIYANLMDYNDKLMDGGRETEQSHRQALQFLHMHYAACDQLIAAFGIQRVDFHGSRLHAVVLTPAGNGREGERVAQALAFAAAFREMAERTRGRYGADFGTRVRIGIDSGPAVAVNSGKKDEPEPLFIGSPANHAAKLAVGDDEGIFLSARAQALRGGVHRFTAGAISRLSLNEETAAIDSAFGPGLGRRRLEEAFSAFVEDQDALGRTQGGQARAVFSFHEHNPPLKTIEFADHPPSNAIRMLLVSLFADIDGFTSYVDAAIATGTVAQAVANLHVMRGEMAAVLRDDFGGRKIRFIGDCLHGLLAEGTANNIDVTGSVKAAVLASGGIRSSFDLCRSLLPGASQLGIAIGLELGVTPVCRLGLRGDASVRCSSSRATCLSEEEQQRCDGRQTALGASAHQAADAMVRQAFGPERVTQGLTYANAMLLLGSAPVRAKEEPMRAHVLG